MSDHHTTPVVVITGSTKGIGYGMVEALVAKHCKVVISSRKQDDINRTIERLVSKGAQQNHLTGCACDVTKLDDVQKLWQHAIDTFGRIDIWVNNAGTTNAQVNFEKTPPHELKAVVDTNMLGVVNGSYVAINGMLHQGFGALYNMEGFGSDGSRQPGMALYGATKYGLRYLTLSMAEEHKKSPIVIALLSPGVVVTDLVISVYEHGDPANWDRMHWLFKFVADPPEVVCPWLVDCILTNKKTGVRLAWITIPKVIFRMLNPYYHRRDLFASLKAGSKLLGQKNC